MRSFDERIYHDPIWDLLSRYACYESSFDSLNVLPIWSSESGCPSREALTAALLSLVTR